MALWKLMDAKFGKEYVIGDKLALPDDYVGYIRALSTPRAAVPYGKVILKIANVPDPVAVDPAKLNLQFVRNKDTVS